MANFKVWALDVWGHSGDDCAEHDCRCMRPTDALDGTREHDVDRCDCHYDVNDRSPVGTVEIPDGADDGATLAALEAGEYVHASLCEVDEYAACGEDGIDIVAKADGRPLLQLEKLDA